TVHLAFQHSNLDYSLGWLRRVIGVAETHRWHHKRDFEDAQVNFGEFLLVWDQLLGTFYDSASKPSRGHAEIRGKFIHLECKPLL
ncbi:sterol desaturase family protein, partial [Pseudomonas aeruginosa]